MGVGRPSDDRPAYGPLLAVSAALRKSEEFGDLSNCFGDDVFRHPIFCGYSRLWPELYSISDEPLHVHPQRAASLPFSDCRFKPRLSEFSFHSIAVELQLFFCAAEAFIAILHSGIIVSQDWNGFTALETKQLPADWPPNAQAALINRKRSSIRPWANSC